MKYITKPVRKICCTFPKIGIVKKPNFKKNGLSFIVPVKDEERLIKPALLSIEPVADEIIVIDSSSEDKTTEIVSSLSKEYEKIKHATFHWNNVNSHSLALHIGLVSASYRWIFKWDADMIGRSKEDLMDWKKRLDYLDKDRYYVIDVTRINLEGDLQHQNKYLPFGLFEGRIFTWSPNLKWSLKTNNVEQISGNSIWGHRFPPWYKILQWEDPYIFHLNIKSTKRRLERIFWTDYMRIKGEGFEDLDEYVRYRVKNDWDLSYEDGLKKAIDYKIKNQAPYDKERFGDLPKILFSS